MCTKEISYYLAVTLRVFIILLSGISRKKTVLKVRIKKEFSILRALVAKCGQRNMDFYSKP